MNIRMMENRVLVKRDETEKTTASGLVIPDSVQRPGATGIVVATGPRADRDGRSLGVVVVSTGERVYFHRHAGYEIEYGGEKYTVLEASDILAVLL